MSVKFVLPQYPFKVVICYDQIAAQISVVLIYSFSLLKIQFSVVSPYFEFRSADHSIQNTLYISSLKTHAANATRILLQSETQKE